MIGKSLANDFQYTKLKDKQYLQFKCTMFFNFCFFLFSLFISSLYYLFFVCLLKLALSLNSIFSKFHFYLMYYWDNSTEHYKVISILHAVEIVRFFRRKQETKFYGKRKQETTFYSLLEYISYYWLNAQWKSNFQQVYKFLVEVLSVSIANMPVKKSILYC